MDTSELLKLADAAELLSELTGDPVIARTLRNWAKRGSQGVRLRTRWHKGAYLTSLDWIAEYQEEVARRRGAPPTKSTEPKLPSYTPQSIPKAVRGALAARGINTPGDKSGDNASD